MTDDNNVIEFAPQEKEVLEALGIEEPPAFHTILEVWREVLKPAQVEATKKIGPSWAVRIVAQYQGITFADIEAYRDRYFGKLAELYQILLDEIASDADCLTYDNAEDDAVENAQHYKNLLLEWQKTFLLWELTWHSSDPDAAIEVAALSEVHRMFFGENGMTNHLDLIKFEFTPEDQQALRDELEALKEAQ